MVKKLRIPGKRIIEFILGDAKRVKEIDQQIVGLKENEEKDFDVNYPKDHNLLNLLIR